jgi:hypothetical protein
VKFGTELIIDVKTFAWTIAAFNSPLGPSGMYKPGGYSLMYRARLRLVDAINTNLLAQGDCVRMPENTSRVFSYEDLIEEGASGLKAEFRDAAQFCVAEFTKQIIP